MIDERTELLINRKLDGELSDQESLELDKLLIRSPEARRLLEECEHHDRLAAATLHSMFDRPGQARTAVLGRLKRKRDWWYRLLPVTGVAAAIVLVAVTGGLPRARLPQMTDDRPLGPGTEIGQAAIPVTPAVAMPAFDAMMVGPRREDRRLMSDVIGVVDPETNSIYLLQMDRRQTVVTPDVREY